MRSRSFATTEPAEPKEIDACQYILALCKQLQTTCLDRCGIDCLVDGQGAGRLPEAACRMLGFMVCELVNDAGECSQLETMPRRVTVTLRRRGTTWLCTISCQGPMDPYQDAQPGLQRVRQLAAELCGSCMVRPMPDRGITAIMFDVHLVERCYPAAIRRYPVGEAWRRADRHHPNVLE
jgi:two-component sensor histidine kinase